MDVYICNFHDSDFCIVSGFQCRKQRRKRRRKNRGWKKPKTTIEKAGRSGIYPDHTLQNRDIGMFVLNRTKSESLAGREQQNQLNHKYLDNQNNRVYALESF